MRDSKFLSREEKSCVPCRTSFQLARTIVEGVRTDTYTNEDERHCDELIVDGGDVKRGGCRNNGVQGSAATAMQLYSLQCWVAVRIDHKAWETRRLRSMTLLGCRW